jgi:sec-independent protein translocase protein TatA
MGFDQPTHWLVIIAVGLILFFGYKKLPEMARSAGRSLRIFKTEMKGMADDDDVRRAAKETSALPPAQHAADVPAPPPPPGGNGSVSNGSAPNGSVNADVAPTEPPTQRAD